jgi:hypothetical protein
MNTQQLTRSQIERLLGEAEIYLRDYANDEEYDLSELEEERELLVAALENGDYLDCEEER